MDAGPVPLRRSVFLAGGRTRGRKAIGGVVGRGNPTESLRTKIAAKFKLKRRGPVSENSRRLRRSISASGTRRTRK